MKSKIQESLIDMSNIQKYEGTAGNIVKNRGGEPLKTHSSAKDVVSILERMFLKEDKKKLNEMKDERGYKTVVLVANPDDSGTSEDEKNDEDEDISLNSDSENSSSKI